MLYNPPTGAATANDSYVGKNPTTGTQGSKIPPAVPEFTQREIVAAIIEAGIAPTNTDLKQLMRAIRSGRMSIYQDVGTPNAIIATSLTAHTSYVPGMPLCIKLANSTTGATTLNLDGLGVLPVIYPGGNPLQRYDFLANDILFGRINTAGTAFVVLSPISQQIIDGAIVKSVHGTGADFADLNAALAWLNRRRIAMTGSVTFQLAAGVNANKIVYTQNINFQHPDGQRVVIQGQPLAGVLPAGSALTYTGSGAGARLSDTTNNLAVLRNVYTTEIYFQNGAGFIGRGSLGALQDVLLTSDGAGASDLLVWATGGFALTRGAVVGAGGRGIALSSVYLLLNGTNYALGNAGYGIDAEAASTVVGAASHALIASSNGATGIIGVLSTMTAITGGLVTYARGNVGDGVTAQGGRFNASASSVSRDNGGIGFNAVDTAAVNVTGTTASGNLYGYQATNLARMDAANTSGTNTTYGYVALNGSNLNRAGGTATGSTAASTPAVGSAGNNNAYIS